MTKSVFTARYDRFRDLLVPARKRAGLSQTEVANRLSAPQSFGSKCERGERRVDVVEFLDFMRAIGTDPVQILRELDQGAGDGINPGKS